MAATITESDLFAELDAALAAPKSHLQPGEFTMRAYMAAHNGMTRYVARDRLGRMLEQGLITMRKMPGNINAYRKTGKS